MGYCEGSYTGCCVSHEEGGLAHKGVLLLQHKQGHQIHSFQFFLPSFKVLSTEACKCASIFVSILEFLIVSFFLPFFNGRGLTSLLCGIRVAKVVVS